MHSVGFFFLLSSVFGRLVVKEVVHVDSCRIVGKSQKNVRISVFSSANRRYCPQLKIFAREIQKMSNNVPLTFNNGDFHIKADFMQILKADSADKSAESARLGGILFLHFCKCFLKWLLDTEGIICMFYIS
jgi:hypothetical protein